MVDKEAFAHWVEDCLANFYDTARLQASPLIEQFRLPDSDAETVWRLRAMLRDAIELLRPPETIPYTAPEWLSYRVLQRRYIDNQSEVETCQELGISRSTYFRHRREALNAVCDILWEQLRRTGQMERLDEGPSGSETHYQPVEAEVALLSQSAQPQWVDIAPILHEACDTVRALADRHSITIRLEMTNPLPPFSCDAGLLRQMIVSVMAEAMAHVVGHRMTLSVSAASGRIIWSLGPLALPPIETADPGRAFEFLRAFTRLYRGETAWQRDENDRAYLMFSLPTAKPALVMIIDNDQDLTRLYGFYLREAGLDVCVAHSAAELEAQLAEVTPDLVLLDLLMPQQGGWSILQRLKSDPETRDIPVIICSILSHAELALALGASKVLQKPITRDVLTRVVQQALAEASMRA